MVIQKAIDNLKDKPKDDRKAVAGGIAIGIVLLLLLGWGFFFFKRVQSGAQLQQLGGGAQDEFNFSSVREAQEQLMQDFSDFDELRTAREQSGAQYQGTAVEQEAYEGSPDPFSQPSGSY